MQDDRRSLQPPARAGAVVHLHRLPRADFDAAKGLLILLVVLGHNALLTESIPHLYQVLYGFHVVGFLLLPFLLPAPVLSGRVIRDRAVRYLVPFLMFYLATSVVFFARYGQIQDFAAWLGHVVMGLLGSSVLVKRASGFELFWFLPTLFTLTLMRSVCSAANRATRIAWCGGLILVHPLIGALPADAKVFLPWGLPIAAYVFPLGVLTGYVWHRFCVQNSQRAAAVAIGLFVCCALGMIALGDQINIGRVHVYAYDEPGRLVLQDALMIVGFVVIMSIAPWAGRLRAIDSLGRYSLPIYLTHSLVYQICYQACEHLGLVSLALSARILLGCALLAATLGASWAVARCLTSITGLQRVVLPRSFAEWRAAF